MLGLGAPFKIFELRDVLRTQAVPRGVLAEEVLPAPHSDAQVVAEDIKCWTAGGRTLFMHHTRSRFGHADKRDTFYDALTLRPRLDIRFGAGPFCGLGHLLGMPAALCLPHASRRFPACGAGCGPRWQPAARCSLRIARTRR